MPAPNTATTAKVTRARAGLVLDAPFFGALALRLTLREDTTQQTGWTDGATLGYNPAWIDKLTLDETKGWLAHEVLHLAAAHHARRQERDPKRWNMAADQAINPILLASGFRLPPGGATGHGQDQSAEAIYASMPADPPPNAGPGKDKQGQPDEDPGQCGAVRDAPGPDDKPATQQEMAQAEAESKVAVTQAAAAAKACGKLPAELARLIADVLEPHVPWREVLRRFVDSASRDDYTWRRPNPRYLPGIYLPSLYSEQLRPIVLAVDTSGSIQQAALDQFGAELTAILAETQASATIIYCDSRVQDIEEVTPADLPLHLAPKGGGGTDFRPPFAHVDANGLQPSCLIYLTDGECSRFPEPPEYPVLWAATGRKFTPPWGEVVPLHADA